MKWFVSGRDASRFLDPSPTPSANPCVTRRVSGGKESPFQCLAQSLTGKPSWALLGHTSVVGTGYVARFARDRGRPTVLPTVFRGRLAEWQSGRAPSGRAAVRLRIRPGLRQRTEFWPSRTDAGGKRLQEEKAKGASSRSLPVHQGRFRQFRPGG